MWETGLAFKFMWVLVLFLGYPDLYNPVNEASWSYGAFLTEEECEEAKVALEKGFRMQVNPKGHLVCVYEEALVTK